MGPQRKIYGPVFEVVWVWAWRGSKCTCKACKIYAISYCFLISRNETATCVNHKLVSIKIVWNIISVSGERYQVDALGWNRVWCSRNFTSVCKTWQVSAIRIPTERKKWLPFKGPDTSLFLSILREEVHLVDWESVGFYTSYKIFFTPPQLRSNWLTSC